MNRIIYKILIGVGLGGLFSYLSVVMVYRTGMSVSAALITPFIIYLLLKILYNPSLQEITLVQSFITGASMAVFCLDSAFAAGVIFGTKNPRVSTVELIILAICMNLFGVLFSLSLVEKWIKKNKLPFPKAKLVGEIINTLNTHTKEKDKKHLFGSIGSSLLICTLTSIFKKLLNPFSLIGKTPPFIGVEISPLLFGLGMFLPLNTVVLMLVGAGYSILIWMIESTTINLTYNQFLFNSKLFSVAMGLAFGYTIYSLFTLFTTILRRKKMKNIKEDSIKNYKIKSISISILMLLICAMAKFSSFNLSVISVVILMCTGYVVCLMLTRLRVETGMGISSPVFLLIPIIYLMNKDLTTILLLSGGIVLSAVASYSSLEASYIGFMTQTSLKKVITQYLLGAVFGSVIGCLVMIFLNAQIGIGKGNLLAPSALAWGTFAKAIVSGSDLPGINITLLIITMFIGFILPFFKISSILISVGMLIPPSSIIIIFLGGLVFWKFGKKERSIPISKIRAGLIIGEGMASLLKSLFI